MNSSATELRPECDQHPARHRIAVSRKRVAYADAARAARAALGRARRAKRTHKLRPFARDVLDALIELIPLYSRLTDEVSSRQIAATVYLVGPHEVSGYQRDRVGQALRQLRDAGVVEVQVGAGRFACTIVTFPCAQQRTRDDDEGDIDSTDVPTSTNSIQPNVSVKPARRDGQSSATGGQHREDVPEKAYEKSEPALRQTIIKHYTRRGVPREEIEVALEDIDAMKAPEREVALAFENTRSAGERYPRQLVERVARAKEQYYMGHFGPWE